MRGAIKKGLEKYFNRIPDTATKMLQNILFWEQLIKWSFGTPKKHGLDPVFQGLNKQAKEC